MCEHELSKQYCFAQNTCDNISKRMGVLIKEYDDGFAVWSTVGNDTKLDTTLEVQNLLRLKEVFSRCS